MQKQQHNNFGAIRLKWQNWDDNTQFWKDVEEQSPSSTMFVEMQRDSKFLENNWQWIPKVIKRGMPLMQHSQF